ncbi:MAG TPA: hypothetical protein VEJ20_00790, partial [Candidatus Eremiobacteraceae bacterium]|nr:hypothetical protein [Candidatus Eremiobacteraceae bacterium]
MNASAIRRSTAPLLCGLMLGAMLCGGTLARASGSPSSSAAGGSASAADVVALVLRDNPGLQSYQAHVHLDVRQ